MSEHERDRFGDAAEEHASAYVDDELTMRERMEVEARMADDAAFAAVVHEVRATRDAVRALPWHEPPAGAIDDAMTAVGRRAVAEGKAAVLMGQGVVESSGRSTRRQRVVRWGAGIAAVAAVAVAFIVPADGDSTPQIPELTEAHLAGSVSPDPVAVLANMAVPTGFER